MTLKKTFYIILTMVFGGIMGCLIYGLISLAVLLPVILYKVFVLAGAFGGFFLGFYWWRIVYIEHRHWHHWRKQGGHKL